MGYLFQFVTLAGFHALNASMFELAHGYAEEGMSAYVRLQEREIALEADGYTATRHQREVGTGYFDLVADVTRRTHLHDGLGRLHRARARCDRRRWWARRPHGGAGARPPRPARPPPRSARTAGRSDLGLLLRRGRRGVRRGVRPLEPAAPLGGDHPLRPGYRRAPGRRSRLPAEGRRDRGARREGLHPAQRRVRAALRGNRGVPRGTDDDPPGPGRRGGGSRLDRRADRRPRPRSAEPGPARRAVRRSELGAERPRGLPDDRPVVRPRRLRRADGLRYERPMGARRRNRHPRRRDAPRRARGRSPRDAGRGDRAGRDGRDRPYDGRSSTRPPRRSSPCP